MNRLCRMSRVGPVFLLVVLMWTSPIEGALYPDKRPLPDPLGYVSDHAGVFDEEWKGRTRSVAKDLERKTGVEMVIVTVKDIGSYRTANDYASALYERWGIGSAQQEHGVLILAVIGEGRAAIVLGRSMMGVVTPPLLEEISNRFLDPMFRTGHYGEGLYRAAVSIAAASREVQAGGETRVHMRGLGMWLTFLTGAGALAFLWWISRPDLRHPFGKIRRGEFWSSGQGGFRGNLGGFGGGTSGEGWR